MNYRFFHRITSSDCLTINLILHPSSPMNYATIYTFQFIMKFGALTITKQKWLLIHLTISLLVCNPFSIRSLPSACKTSFGMGSLSMASKTIFRIKVSNTLFRPRLLVPTFFVLLHCTYMLLVH